VLPSKDESNNSSLPREELNPLLNPFLAAHMGRWAEAYFTSPPENREQAVADLVRDLEGESTLERLSLETNRNDPESSDRHRLTCQRCGYRNSADHEFCGMCGSPLAVDELLGPLAVGVRTGTHENRPPAASELIGESVEESVADDDRGAREPPQQQFLQGSVRFDTLLSQS
jgi:hypothetical protein